MSRAGERTHRVTTTGEVIAVQWLMMVMMTLGGSSLSSAQQILITLAERNVPRHDPSKVDSANQPLHIGSTS